MALYAVIGDVHGCIEEYTRILDEIDSQFPTAIKIQLGDLLHKGPDSAACVQTTMERVHEFCRGNHEDKHLRWLAHERRPGANPMKHVEEYPSVGLTPEQEDFIANRSRLYFRDPDDGLIVIHAGILSSIKTLPKSLWKDIPGHDQKYFKTIMMTRYESPDGQMVMMGEEKPTDIWWAARYDGRFGFAIYGHQHYDTAQPVKFPSAMGIDLGCVYGNKLCAVIVHNGSPVDFITVNAARKYKEPLKLEKS